MNTYEVMYIIKPFEQEEIDKVITKFSNLLKDNGAEILKTESWGKKRLAYEIQDLFEGFYVLLTFKADPSAVKELDRVMNITEDIMRHLVIRKECL